MDIPYTVFIVCMLVTINHSFRDDMFSFVSFENISEWREVYHQCDSSYTFVENRTWEFWEITNLNQSHIPHNLSPQTLSTKEAKRNTDHPLRREFRGSLLVHNPPPAKIVDDYFVSYGFQSNRECAFARWFAPCYVSSKASPVRAVVLSSNRRGLSELRDTFEVDDPDNFPSIQFGHNDHNKRFYDAVFLGSPGKCSTNSTRGSHIVDGKCYPMEIYMYFVDETYPAMSGTNVLVVLVEESDEENINARPIVNAVKHVLYHQERRFIKKNEVILQRERMFHHLGDSYGLFGNSRSTRTLEESWRLEQTVSKLTERLERFQEFQAHNFFQLEELNDMKELIQITKPEIRSLFTSIPFVDENEKVKENKRFVYAISKQFEMSFKAYKSNAEYTPGLIKNETTGETAQAAAEKVEEEIRSVVKKIDEILDERERVREIPEYHYYVKHPREINEEVKQAVQGYSRKLKTIHEDFCRKLTALVNEQIFPECKENPLCSTDPNCAEYNCIRKGDEFREYDQVFAKSTDLTMVCSPVSVVSYLKKLVRAEHRRDELSQELQDALTQTGYKISFEENLEHDLNDYPELESVFHQVAGDYWSELNWFSLLRVIEYKRRGKMSDSEGFYGNLGMTDKEYNEYLKLKPLQVPILNQFQVSWLIPDGGGYFVYKGSSPLPPCSPTFRTIVFKKPIKMSRYQIEWLTKVPTYWKEGMEITNTFGVRHDKRKSANSLTEVYFENKNHEFMDNDGVHEITAFHKKSRH